MSLSNPSKGWPHRTHPNSDGSLWTAGRNELQWRALAATLDRELVRARTALWQASRTLLAPYLVFSVGGVRELLAHLLSTEGDYGQLTHRNSRAGDRERHLLLYLQRIAAKNDTFSEFGPSAWGRIDND